MTIRKRTWIDDNGKHQTRYDVRVRKRGAPALARTFRNRTVAESWEREQILQIESGAYKSTRKAETMTLADALDRYIKDVLPDKKSAGWVESMSRTIGDDVIARYPLIALGSEDLAGYRDRRLAAKARGTITRKQSASAKVTTSRELKRTVSAETVRKELSLISRAIDHVRREAGVHLAAGNPAGLVRRPKPAKARDRRLRGDEEQRLLAAAAQNPDEPGGAHARTRWLQPVIIFAIETGARRGEICALDWKDVDFTRCVATFRDTKNGEDRSIPLSSRAVKTLRALPRPLKGGKVFPLTPNALGQQWKRLVVRAEIDDLQFHDLRHEAVSRLFEKGMREMAVSSISGHKTFEMLKRYTHLRAEDLVKMLD